MNDLSSSVAATNGGVHHGLAPPQPSAAAGVVVAGSAANNTSAHLNLLRDELRDSVLEEERVLDRMAELAQTRSTLKVQVQKREAEAEIGGIRRRQEKLQAARHALRL